MGTVIITLEVLPESPEVDLDKIVNEINKIINEIGGKVINSNIEPFVFGLKKIVLKFSYPEKEFNEEVLLEKINSIEGVQSSEIVSVTRSFY